MSTPRIFFSAERWSSFLTNPQHRTLHAVIITLLLLAHLALHYATYFPPLREPFANLPYFRLHSLHEAEFVFIIVYASLVFRLAGGLIAIIITAISSIPFAVTPYIFGRAPRTDELRDLVIQVAFILFMAFAIVLLQEFVTRERERRIWMAERVAEANLNLKSTNDELERVNQRLEQSNRELTALNQMVQSRVNSLYDHIQEAVEGEQTQLAPLPPSDLKTRFSGFLQRIDAVIRG
ncbi:MAG: hypothetical protein HY666_01715 [Chloroflexi bacterium]|nr:hypothetical protein [Chloroflexota bacterium]